LGLSEKIDYCGFYHKQSLSAFDRCSDSVFIDVISTLKDAFDIEIRCPNGYDNPQIISENPMADFL